MARLPKQVLLLALVLTAAAAASATIAAPSPAPNRGDSLLDRLIRAVPGAQAARELSFSALDTVRGALGRALEVASDGLHECLNCSQDPDSRRNVSEIIVSRGFKAEEYDVVTKDGYILTVQRIVNPLVAPGARSQLYPVILQHGLMSSSVDWVINSLNVRPEPFPAPPKRAGPKPALNDTQAHPNALGFYLANRGYDVFLANSRGNVYGQRHIKMNSWEPRFWDFTFDEQIKYDLRDTIRFVQQLTNKTKLGYVGHSQGTTMGFGLLSDYPEYADVVEPFVALAPVAYVSHTKSPVRYFAVYTPVFQNVNMWFGTSNVAVRYLAPLVCKPEVVRKELCANIFFLSTGFDEAELDQARVDAYLTHMPSGTSVKNIAHYGQEVLSGRFAHYDHGLLGNQMRYGQRRAPDYDLAKIRSKSIALFVAENDWLAAPADVAHLRASMRSTRPHLVVNMTELNPQWNHIDFVYAKHAGEWVNPRVFQVFDHFAPMAARPTDAAHKNKGENHNNNNSSLDLAAEADTSRRDDDDDDYDDDAGAELTGTERRL